MSIDRIALYHLETLQWIARLGTFRAAAERLNITQPTISARIRELEAHLGIRLFRREGRMMTLTPAGRQVVRQSEPLWSQFQNILLGSGGMSETTGIVRIGAGEIAAASCLPGFVAQLQQDLPNVSLEVEIALTADLIQHILTGKTDLVFGAGRIAHPALRTTPIGSVDLNPATSATATGGSASVTVALKAGKPVQIIARSSAPAVNAVAAGASMTTTLKQGATTLDSDTAYAASDNSGNGICGSANLMAVFTPPTDGNYTFAVANAVSTTKAIVVLRTYKG